MDKNPYELEEILNQYLFFHYGDSEHYSSFIPKEFLDFPKRCVAECVNFQGKKALDIGCAVGRSSFELSKKFEKVIGIDYSEKFIQYANLIKQEKNLNIKIQNEGSLYFDLKINLPSEAHAENVSFFRDDALNLTEDYFDNDLVFAANLLCRLPEPRKFLELSKKLVRKSGHLVLISPYSWLEEYTPQEHWLGKELGSEQNILKILEPDFNLEFKKELPFVIREHSRKYQFGLSQGLIFRKN